MSKSCQPCLSRFFSKLINLSRPSDVHISNLVYHSQWKSWYLQLSLLSSCQGHHLKPYMITSYISQPTCKDFLSLLLVCFCHLWHPSPSFSCFHNSPAFYSHLHPFSPLYQGFFLLINGFGSKNGEKAVISVPVITRASPICVDFWYHMLGPSVSNLDLLVQTVCNLFNTTEPSVSGCALYHLQISSHSFT